MMLLGEEAEKESECRKPATFLGRFGKFDVCNECYERISETEDKTDVNLLSAVRHWCYWGNLGV